ncbi:MAG: AbrB family transcriptional regulator [Geminicoccaceae bacterium]|nr:AbrB family transcriptional regulator [Geminicoccaceae bacterium]
MNSSDIARLFLALLVGAAGAAMFLYGGLPLAWMLGPMLATMLASLLGAPIAVPAALRGPTIAVLGVLLGSSFDRETLALLMQWAPIVAALPGYVAVVVALAFAYLRRIARLDARTAWFAATPGGLGEMVVLGDRAGGDAPTIALLHSTRIFLVVFAIPFGLRALGYEIPTVPATGRVAPGAWDLAAMTACGLVGFFAGRLLRMPAPALLGPMLASAAAHLLGAVQGAPPVALVAAAQLVIGAQVGARFSGYPILRVVATVTIGAGLTVLMLALAALGGWALARATGLPVLLLLLALAPGGLAEMSLVALALTDEPALVAAVHIVRITLVVFAAPSIFRFLARRFGETKREHA